MRKILLSSIILLALTACNKKSTGTDIAEMPANQDLTATIESVPQDTHNSLEENNNTDAIEKNDIEKVKELLASETVYGDKSSFLDVVRNGDKETVLALLESSANEPHKILGLYMAVIANRIDLIKALLETGINVEGYLAADKDSEFFDFYLQKEETQIVRSPLMTAVYHGVQPEIIDILLRSGADVTKAHSCQTQGECSPVTVLDLAYYLHSKPEIIDLLKRAGAHRSLEKRLMEAVENKNLALVQQLIKEGASPNATSLDGHSALEIAALQDNLEILRTLLAAGGNPNLEVSAPCWLEGCSEADEFFDSFLFTVYSNGASIDSLRTLVNAGTNVKKAINAAYTTTVLLDASEKGKLAIVKLLLQAGADPNEILEPECACHMGTTYTALMRAKDNGHTEIVELLRAAGAKE